MKLKSRLKEKSRNIPLIARVNLNDLEKEAEKHLKSHEYGILSKRYLDIPEDTSQNKSISTRIKRKILKRKY